MWPLSVQPHNKKLPLHMNPINLITKKRDGEELTAEELQFFIEGYVKDQIPDYQVAAFLMAVYFQGMSFDEAATLTRIMRDSGTVLDLRSIPGIKADKHSTGGVGDKVSLVLAPLVASAGLIVPMISGRALAHTGGTLDKLESIPGFRTNLTPVQFMDQLAKIGVALIGQTRDICPADKKMYALRDATGTVQSIPLITASILSKKLAEGIDVLVLDVKAGKGAIFPEQEKAWQLAETLVKTALKFDLKTAAVITNMEQPLGNAVGNWLETREAIETLCGNGPEDLVEVTLTLGAMMLFLAGQAKDLETAKSTLRDLLESGKAFTKFEQIVKAQGGDPSYLHKPESYPKAKFEMNIQASKEGYLAEINARTIGEISMNLGCGRTKLDDPVDYTAGIILKKKVGEYVKSGDLLAVAYSNQKELLQSNRPHLQNAFLVKDEPVPKPPLIYSLFDEQGETQIVKR